MDSAETLASLEAELMRVKARERRYRADAEARIAELERQLQEKERLSSFMQKAAAKEKDAEEIIALLEEEIASAKIRIESLEKQLVEQDIMVKEWAEQKSLLQEANELIGILEAEIRERNSTIDIKTKIIAELEEALNKREMQVKTLIAEKDTACKDLCMILEEKEKYIIELKNYLENTRKELNTLKDKNSDSFNAISRIFHRKGF